MNRYFFFTICLIFLISVTFSFKENSGFQLHQKQIDETQQVHKTSKKARIAEQQQFQLHDFLGSLKETIKSIKKFIEDIFDSLILRKAKTIEKSSIIYRQNFASQNGGAQILMVSSSKIKSPRAILRSDPDAYLFTADVLPITIVIGLKQQILIDSFGIQSGQVYSCITQDFMIEGAFSLQNQEWILLGNFTAENSFQVQQFAVQQKIIRYIRLTIISSYGKWKYFTLSHIKVFGQGLFSHAMQSLLQTQYNIQTNKSTDGLHKKNSSKKAHIDKFSNKEIHTKQILVEAFEQLVIEGKQDLQNQKNKHATSKQTSSNQFLAQQNRHNEPQISTKSTKQKKSITILKKKIEYLQKRNFELNNLLKDLKLETDEKFIQLQGKHSNTGHKHHHDKWYEFLLTSQSMIIFSMIINIICLVLVAMVFKNKIFSRRMSQSQQLNNSRSKFQKSQGQKQKNSNQIKQKTN